MIPDRSPSVTLVIAAVDARATVAASLEGFLREVRGRGEVLLIDASRDGTADLAAELFPEVRILRRPPGTLVPLLWRDGLRAASSPLVGFTTAQMVPRVGWFQGLLEAHHHTGAAVIGGPIEPGVGLSARNRALYLHRYARYREDPSSDLPADPPGDNALFRREALSGLESLWAEGVWEAELYPHLRASGQTLAMAPAGMVEFRGQSGWDGTLRRRFAHARRYAATRRHQWGRAHQFARAAAAPLVFVRLLARALKPPGSRGEGPWSLARAVPPLMALVLAWTIGEALGIWRGTSSEIR